MKPSKVIKPIKKPIRQVGSWCAQVWDGLSGKDSRRIKQLQKKLEFYKQQETDLTQKLERSQQCCVQLQQDLDQRQQLLETNQQTLERSQKECQDLWQELNDLDEFVTTSERQIQTLKTELANRTAALANCEANLDLLQRSSITETIPAAAPTSEAATAAVNTDLANWKIGFVGGHDATRRVVTRTLQTDHGLVYTPVEIPPHHDAKTSQKQLREKLAECDLVVSIIGYSSHVLTKSLSQLKEKGALKAEVLTPRSRGVTGVVRDILSFVQAHPDLVEGNAG